MSTVYTIIRNKTNEIMFVTDNYNFIKEYVIKHFSKYTINDKYEMIVLHSNNFTLNKNQMNYDSYFDKEYK